MKAKDRCKNCIFDPKTCRCSIYRGRCAKYIYKLSLGWYDMELLK